MLTPGMRFDPCFHPSVSAPMPMEPASIEVPTQLLRRRRAADGTQYCCCCDTVLAPTAGRGRPPAICEGCRVTRRRGKRTAYETARVRNRRRESQPTHVDTKAAALSEVNTGQPSAGGVSEPQLPAHVVTALHRLAEAVERAPRDFLPRYGATWEGKLLREARTVADWHRGKFVNKSGFGAQRSADSGQQ